MAEMTCDEAEHPLVVMTWPAEPVTTQRLDEFYVHVDRLLAARTPIAIVLDSTHATAFDATARKYSASALKARDEPFSKHVILALVLKRGFQRGATIALAWLYPPKHPQRVFSTVGEAKRSAHAELAARAGRQRSSA